MTGRLAGAAREVAAEIFMVVATGLALHAAGRIAIAIARAEPFDYETED